MEDFIGRFTPLEFVLLINGAALALYIALVVLFSFLPSRIRLTVTERKKTDEQ